MPQDDVMAVNERLSNLEKTVATGFFDHGQKIARLEEQMSAGFFEHGRRIDRLENRMSALESKLDVVAESLRDDIRTVLDAVVGNTDEMRRTTQALRGEHEADRRLMREILNDHAVRIRSLERSDPLEPR
jgi:hypothetical protein